jgi:hypothetical protein
MDTIFNFYEIGNMLSWPPEALWDKPQKPATTPEGH